MIASLRVPVNGRGALPFGKAPDRDSGGGLMSYGSATPMRGKSVTFR